MGDGPDIPWRLLDIGILVEDPETGGTILSNPVRILILRLMVKFARHHFGHLQS